jgi:hypothetical protein
MTKAQFWKIIAKACRSDPEASEEWHEGLVKCLSRLSANEILEFDRIFDEMTNEAYTADLWDAAYLINGGASDDGFYYFRCWLVCMGKKVYEAALGKPDTLAKVVDPSIEAEAERGASCEAWQRVTGQPDDAFPPGVTQLDPELKGEVWDYDDDDEVRKRLPRLAALYMDEE